MNVVDQLLKDVLDMAGVGEQPPGRDPHIELTEEERKGIREHRYCWDGCAARKAWKHIHMREAELERIHSV